MVTVVAQAFNLRTSVVEMKAEVDVKAEAETESKAEAGVSGSLCVQCQLDLHNGDSLYPIVKPCLKEKNNSKIFILATMY